MMTVAIIPARAGSKGVTKKNIRHLGGYPLIAYSIVAAKLAKTIDRVVVSTDSEEIARIAGGYGAEVPFLRPEEFAADHSPDKDFIKHAIDWFKEHEGNAPQYLVHLRPTTPLRDPDVIDQAIIQIRNTAEATSLRSAHSATESPFKWFTKTEEGYFQGLLPDSSNEAINDPRQTFAPVYIPNGYVDVLKTSFINEHDVLHGKKMIGFVTPVCHEVDSMEELEYLEYQVREKGHRLFEDLKNQFPSEVEHV